MPVTAVTPRGTDNPTIKGIFAEKNNNRIIVYCIRQSNYVCCLLQMKSLLISKLKHVRCLPLYMSLLTLVNK